MNLSPRVPRRARQRLLTAAGSRPFLVRRRSFPGRPPRRPACSYPVLYQCHFDFDFDFIAHAQAHAQYRLYLQVQTQYHHHRPEEYVEVVVLVPPERWHRTSATTGLSLRVSAGFPRPQPPAPVTVSTAPWPCSCRKTPALGEQRLHHCSQPRRASVHNLGEQRLLQFTAPCFCSQPRRAAPAPRPAARVSTQAQGSATSVRQAAVSAIQL